MGAGISSKAMNARIYRRLKSIQHRLAWAGVLANYHNYQLFRYELEGSQKIGGFNIQFVVLHASNGESAGFPLVRIVDTVRGDFSFGGTKEVNGNFEQGIQTLIDTFAEKAVR